MSEGTKPLVVCDSSGPVDLTSTDDKGYKKTIESGELWARHEDTGRLLPYAEGTPARIENRGSWYCAVLEGPGGPGSGDTKGATAAPEGSGGADTSEQSGSDIGQVLAALVSVIQDRRAEMPDGSYTTHLFSGGRDKIRKKTGEEAIELVLANERASITSEAADLIYHLLVLLEFEGVTLNEISRELKRR